MRISDWSSDVCSSDLPLPGRALRQGARRAVPVHRLRFPPLRKRERVRRAARDPRRHEGPPRHRIQPLLRRRRGGPQGGRGAPGAGGGAHGRPDDLSQVPTTTDPNTPGTAGRRGGGPPHPRATRRTELRVSDSPKIWTYDDSAFRDTATPGMKRRIFNGDDMSLCFWRIKQGLGPTPYDGHPANEQFRSEEHTSELQSLMRISYAVFCLKKKKN